MIGVDGDRVTEFDLMYTVGVNETFKDDTLVAEPTKTVTFKEEVTVPIVELVKEIKAKKKAVKKLSLTDEERRERHKKYMVKYNKEYKEKRKVVAQKEKTAQVEHEPNLKLIQEFGKSTIDQMIICKRQGMTAEEVDDDKPVHCGHLVFGQIERILDTVKW